MNVSELLANLTQQGVQLWADNDKLRIQSPKGILTPKLRTELATHKTEILAFLRKSSNATSSSCASVVNEGLSLHTMGSLIAGIGEHSTVEFKPPIIDSKEMAQKLKVTFRPLPKGYKNETILKFREELELKLRDCGVQVEPWHQATREFYYEVNIPLTKWKRSIRTTVVKTSISAVIDVDRPSSLKSQFNSFVAENLYQFYSRYILRNRKISVSTITKLTGWAEDHAIQRIEDPTNTQVIVITELNKELLNSQLSYQQKIPISVNTLVRTFSEIVVGISSTHISILNMNLSDSIFSIKELDTFVLKSLIPKIYVPILPLPMSRFEIGNYDPHQSSYATSLVRLGREMSSTGLLPSGFQISEVIKKKSHRDIVDWIVNGRTGVSYGFVAYAEPPQYIGPTEILESEWERLSPVEGFSSNELRQNEIGKHYIKTRIGTKYAFKQIPDIWLVSSRSGSNKTDLNIETDILRIGLKNKLLLQLPQGINSAVGDVKPSYDIYVMIAIALSAALYTPELIRNGAPIVHFHGYPSIEWFKSNEYYTGVYNPSVPCGTYESGVFNFLGIHSLANENDSNIALACLIETDHGTNVIAHNLEYLVERLRAGVKQGQIELGGKHFASLKESTTTK